MKYIGPRNLKEPVVNLFDNLRRDYTREDEPCFVVGKATVVYKKGTARIEPDKKHNETILAERGLKKGSIN